MLILLPPSEGKAAPARRGRPLDLAERSFPGSRWDQVPPPTWPSTCGCPRTDRA